MMRRSDQILPFAYGKVIIKILPEGLIVHLIDEFPHIMCRAVCGDQFEPGDWELRVKFRDVLRTHKFEQILGLADTVPVLSDHIEVHDLPEIVHPEDILYDRRFVHAVCHKNPASRSGHSDRF